MAGKVVRRLVVEITEDADVTIDGFGWANVDGDGVEETLWLGGDRPTLVILARQDQIDTPQVVADETWSLERLQYLLAATAHLAQQAAITQDEAEGD